MIFASPALALQRRATRRRAPVLPDNGVVQRLARRLVPDQRGFALVGDADGGDLAGIAPPSTVRQQVSAACQISRRIMLDPAIGGIDWRSGTAWLATGARLAIKQDGPGRGGALVYGQKDDLRPSCGKLGHTILGCAARDLIRC